MSIPSETNTPLAGVFTVFIAFDQPKLPIPSGRILCGYLQEALPFCGLSDMLLKIDSLCDTFNQPQAVLSHRQLHAPAAPVPAAQQPIMRQSPQDLAAQFGRAPVFGLQILYRQHASWQGRFWVHRRPQPSSVLFRSALELLYLLHDALSPQSDSLPEHPIHTS